MMSMHRPTLEQLLPNENYCVILALLRKSRRIRNFKHYVLQRIAWIVRYLLVYKIMLLQLASCW